MKNKKHNRDKNVKIFKIFKISFKEWNKIFIVLQRCKFVNFTNYNILQIQDK